MKRYLSMLLCGVMLLGLLAGCNNKPVETNNRTDREPNPAIGQGGVEDLISKPADGTLSSVGGENFNEEDLNEILPVLRYIYQINPDDENWDSFYQYAVDYMTSTKLYYMILKERGLEINQDDLNEAFETVKNTTGNVDEFYEEIAKFDVTEEMIISFLKDEQVYTLIYNDVVKDVEVTDEEIQTYYDENSELYVNTTARDFYQCVFETKEEAQSKLDEILAGNKTFDEVATEIKAENGGFIATVWKGDLVDPFEKPTWELKENEVYGEVVESDMGYHIITVKNVLENKTFPLEEVHDKIKDILLEDKKSEEFSNFLDDANVKYNVTIY